jgi:5-methylcytosine-specific restriction endonuclease McrA
MRLIDKRGSTELRCQICGKLFKRPNAHIRNGTHSCSRKCAEKIKTRKQSALLTAACLACKQKFTRTKHRKGKMMYCSNECRRSHAMPKRSDHPNWKGGISERTFASRQAIRQRIKEIGKCERCGAIDYLHGHHKLTYSTSPLFAADPANIEILCDQCHSSEHPKYSQMLVFRKTSLI